MLYSFVFGSVNLYIQLLRTHNVLLTKVNWVTILCEEWKPCIASWCCTCSGALFNLFSYFFKFVNVICIHAVTPFTRTSVHPIWDSPHLFDVILTPTHGEYLADTKQVATHMSNSSDVVSLLDCRNFVSSDPYTSSWDPFNPLLQFSAVTLTKAVTIRATVGQLRAKVCCCLCPTYCFSLFRVLRISPL